MKVERHDGSLERAVLVGMASSEPVIAAIATKWPKAGLFASPLANLVGGWLCQHWQEFGKPIHRSSLEVQFEEWASKSQDKETVGLGEEFLASLSGEKVDLDPKHVISLAEKHFNRVALERISDAIKEDLQREEGEIKAAERLGGWSPLELGRENSIRPLSDQELIKRCFEQKPQSIVKYSGDLGYFLKDALDRDSLVAFQGPEKSKKSYFLLDLVWRALNQGLRVAYIECGDLSQNQVLRRLMVRAARRPLKAGQVKWPIYLASEYGNNSGKNGKKTAEVRFKTVEFKRGLDWEAAWKACEKLGPIRDNLRLAVHPNSTLSAAGIQTALEEYERQGFRADVVVPDYSDILAPMPHSGDSPRDQINASWKRLRAISQQFNCLLATATQANAASYSEDLMTMANFSEDKRKNAHASAIIGLNSSRTDRENGVSRLNFTALRENDFSPGQSVAVASCLALANPAVLSAL